MEVNKVQVASYITVSALAIYGAYQWGKTHVSVPTETFATEISKNEVISIKKQQHTSPVAIKKEKPVLNKEIKKVDQTKWVNFLNGLKNNESFDKEKAEVLTEVINKVEDQEIDYYLEQYFEDETLIDINDKRLFSKRLLEEYSDSQNSDEIIDVNGDLYFSTDSSPTQTNKSNFSVKKNQNIFAHLITKTSVAEGKHVFIRWVRESDNQIILFERKRINLNSTSNWVSMRPNNGWNLGAYSVTIYSFESALHVIAKNRYFVDAIIE